MSSRDGTETTEPAEDSVEVAKPALLVVVNKIDRVDDNGILTHLAAVAEVGEALAAEGAGGDAKGDAASEGARRGTAAGGAKGGTAADDPKEGTAAGGAKEDSTADGARGDGDTSINGAAPIPVEYFPVSAMTGDGLDALVDAVLARLPEGPRYYPEGMVTDVAEAFWVADLVREQLLLRVDDELPHSIACRVTEWEWPRVRCEILVERDSQKGIVIGKGGSTLKAVGTAVREQLEPGAYVELFVRVEKRWQQREDALDRLGL